jgi:hypothetical protein
MTITGWLRISGIRWVRFSGTHTDRKSAGQPAVQILYKGSPECSKTPQNALLQPLSHNNIRKTGSIRNRQVTSSTLVVGSIFPSTCVLPSLYGQSIVTWIVT